MNKDASIDDYCEHVSKSCVWSPIFVREALVDDITLVSFLSNLNGVIVHDSSHNPIKWDLNSKGIFTVKSFYIKPKGMILLSNEILNAFVILYPLTKCIVDGNVGDTSYKLGYSRFKHFLATIVTHTFYPLSLPQPHYLFHLYMHLTTKYLRLLFDLHAS